MVHYTKVINGIVSFVDEDMVRKMSGSWKAWCVGTVVALIARSGADVFERFRSNGIVQSLGLVDGEMIDVERIYDELLKQSQRQTATVDIPLIGAVTYSSKDVEDLYRRIVG